MIKSPRTALALDRTVQVASAIEVVGKAESEAAAQIPFQRQVSLLRVGINEVLGLWIAEWLKGKRQKVGRVQVVLIEEN